MSESEEVFPVKEQDSVPVEDGAEPFRSEQQTDENTEVDTLQEYASESQHFEDEGDVYLETAEEDEVEDESFVGEELLELPAESASPPLSTAEDVETQQATLFESMQQVFTAEAQSNVSLIEGDPAHFAEKTEYADQDFAKDSGHARDPKPEYEEDDVGNTKSSKDMEEESIEAGLPVAISAPRGEMKVSSSHTPTVIRSEPTTGSQKVSEILKTSSEPATSADFTSTPASAPAPSEMKPQTYMGMSTETTDAASKGQDAVEDHEGAEGVFINQDDLIATDSANLVPTLSEMRPPAPPASEIGFNLPERAPNREDAAYWEQKLASLPESGVQQAAEIGEHLPGKRFLEADYDRRPDQLGFRAPEEYAQRRSLLGLSLGVTPEFSADRRGVGPYPIYSAPEGVDFSDEEGERDSGGRVYPTYERPHDLSSRSTSPLPNTSARKEAGYTPLALPPSVSRGPDARDPGIAEEHGSNEERIPTVHETNFRAADYDRRPDQLGFRAPEEYARRRSQLPLSLGVTPEFPADRRGVGPYPIYSAPEGVDFSDEEGEPGASADRLYPSHELPESFSSGSTSPLPDGAGRPVQPPLPLPASDAADAGGTESAAEREPSEVQMSAVGDDKGKPVLPPDHPLMARFQRALAGLLQRRMGQADLDLVELRREHKVVTKHREATGVQLYERQLQLSKQQQQQQALVQQLKQAADLRRAAEQVLQQVRESHQENKQKLDADRAREKQLRMDVSNLEKHEYHLKSLENDADTELQLRQKMAERADAEMDKLEQDKQRQDYLIARLTADAERVKTAIRLHQVQARAQTEECSLARQVLAEAQLELETLEMEKKHLQQTWTYSLNTMQKRDEEYSQLNNRISKMAADVHTVDGETAGYVRSIRQAQDLNEQLMMQTQRLNNECEKYQRYYEKCVEQFEIQKQEYARFRGILSSTEDKLYQMNIEQKGAERKLKHLVAEMEKIIDIKRQVEEQILETMQERLTSDNAGKNTAKIIHRTRHITKLMESQVADVENSITRLLLACSNASTAMDFMKNVVEQLLQEVKVLEETLNRYQVEAHRANAVIQHKQNKVQELNTKLGILIAAAGGQELGPLEIMIASLLKSIELLQTELQTIQQYYIRLQNNLVSSVRERDALAHVVVMRRKELLILDQRKIRVERSIDAEAGALHAAEVGVNQLRQALCHLNEKLAGETQLQRSLAANTSVMEYELCHALREVEAQCVRMRGDIADKDRQRAGMLCRMAEAGETELLWEQKITLLKQAKDKLKGESGVAAEVRSMKLEIHRMQVRYGQLLREQERLMTEMERAVDRREAIALRAENADRRDRRRHAASFFQRQQKLEELKRKFKSARKDAAHLASELTRAETQLSEMSELEVPQQRAAVDQLTASLQTLQTRLHQLTRLRAQNLSRIVLKQTSSKYYQSLMEGHYTCRIRSQPRLDSEVDNTDQQHKMIKMLVRQLLRDKPDLAMHMDFLRDLLKI